MNFFRQLKRKFLTTILVFYLKILYIKQKRVFPAFEAQNVEMEWYLKSKYDSPKVKQAPNAETFERDWWKFGGRDGVSTTTADRPDRPRASWYFRK